MELSNYRIDTRRLKSKIALKGYSRTELAKKLKISPQSVTNLTNGKHNPSYELMNNIYRALDLTPNEAAEIFFNNDLRGA